MANKMNFLFLVPVRKKGILRYLSFPNHETRSKSKKSTNESYSFFQEKSSKKSDKNSFYIGNNLQIAWLEVILFVKLR